MVGYVSYLCKSYMTAIKNKKNKTIEQQQQKANYVDTSINDPKILQSEYYLYN